VRSREDIVNAKHKTQGPRIDCRGARQTVFHALHTMQTQDISQLLCSKGIASRRDLRGSDSELALQGKDCARWPSAK